MPTLDSVTFDAGNFTLHGDEDGVRTWYTSSDDLISLHYFPIPPNIPADLESLEDVRWAYRQLTADSGSAIIEVETLTVDGCVALRTIIKVPQQPHGGGENLCNMNRKQTNGLSSIANESWLRVEPEGLAKLLSSASFAGVER